MTTPEPEPKNAKNKTDPPQGPTRRSTRLGTSAPAASRGVNGKGEASPPAEKPKAPRANQRATRNEGGEFLPEEEQDELLLRERSMEAMEQRLLTAMHKELRKPNNLLFLLSTFFSYKGSCTGFLR